MTKAQPKVDNKKIYVYYSPATDVTGKNIAAALNADCGSTLPTTNYDVVIGWGAKTSKAVNVIATKVLNHPNAIRANRNKFGALDLMKKAGVSVAPFVSTTKAGAIGTDSADGVKLPAVARTGFHQGGKGFWDCPTMTHVKNAVKEGADYIQNLIEIEDEYRLHVVGGKVIYGVKKVKRSTEETAEAFIRQGLEKQKALAEKAGRAFDEETAKGILTSQAKMFAQNGANMLVRSNRLGWKFAKISDKKPPAKYKELEQEAIKAVKAVGLDFGAVDCCTDSSGKVFVLEVNSGPGLEETTFDVWMENFKAIIYVEDAKPAEAIKETQTTVSDAKKTASFSKTKLIEKVDLIKDMLTVASEEEAEVVNNVFKKMFG